jgi:hypothetical protein
VSGGGNLFGLLGAREALMRHQRALSSHRAGAVPCNRPLACAAIQRAAGGVARRRGGEEAAMRTRRAATMLHTPGRSRASNDDVCGAALPRDGFVQAPQAMAAPGAAR